jgi:hypothetical protein
MKAKTKNGIFFNREGYGITERVMTLNMGQIYELNMFLKNNEELGKTKPEQALANVLTVLKNIVGKGISEANISELTGMDEADKTWLVIRDNKIFYQAKSQEDAEENCLGLSSVVYANPKDYV